MKYSIGDKIYNRSYNNIVILDCNESTNKYMACLERDLEKVENVFIVDDKTLELYKVGYLYARGEMLKFSCIYDKFKAIYARSVGGSGFRIELDKTPYRILNEEEIQRYKHLDFRQNVLNNYGIEIDEDIYRVEDVIKFSNDNTYCLGEICEVYENYLKVKCGTNNEFVVTVNKDKIIQWFPKDDLLYMQGNDYHKKIVAD